MLYKICLISQTFIAQVAILFLSLGFFKIIY